MKDYWVCVPDSTKVVESTNFIAFDAPARNRELKRADLVKCDAIKAAHREAWDLAKKVYCMTYAERREAFGGNFDTGDILTYDYDDIAEKYAAWEKKKAEEAAHKIEIGEIWENARGISRVVVLNVSDTVVYVVYSDGRRLNLSLYTFYDVYTKTGNKVDENALEFLLSGKED